MRPPSTVTLCTLCLNEMQWLENLYAQHKDWPGLVNWVFVEAADKTYLETNPSLVSSQGLSTDGTTEFLEKLAREDDRVIHIKHGVTQHEDPSLAKCAARERYLVAASPAKPGWLWIIDADEFYTKEHQQEIMDIMEEDGHMYMAFCFDFRHVWRPMTISEQPLFQYEVVGGFWNMAHCRGLRWIKNMQYKNDHNIPCDAYGNRADKQMAYHHTNRAYPYCIHLGHAAKADTRLAKNAYYEARGEGKGDGRRWYVESRAAYTNWKPGTVLPRRAKVFPWTGALPECYPCAKSPSGQHDYFSYPGPSGIKSEEEACRYCYSLKVPGLQE